MEMQEVLRGILFVALWFSWAALVFAAIPVGLTAAGVRGTGGWFIPSEDGQPPRKVHYVLLGVAGGLCGEIVAVASLSFGEWWICFTQHQLCNDGQGGIALVFTLPVLSFFGSLLALAWTWVSLRIASDSVFASVFRYSGRKRWGNWLVAIAIQLAFWPTLTYLVFKVIL
jgi:hypothetical protein